MRAVVGALLLAAGVAGTLVSVFSRDHAAFAVPFGILALAGALMVLAPFDALGDPPDDEHGLGHWREGR